MRLENEKIDGMAFRVYRSEGLNEDGLYEYTFTSLHFNISETVEAENKDEAVEKFEAVKSDAIKYSGGA